MKNRVEGRDLCSQNKYRGACCRQRSKIGSGTQGDKSQVKGQAKCPKSKQTRLGPGMDTQNTVVGTCFGANQKNEDCMDRCLQVPCPCDRAWPERGQRLGRFCQSGDSIAPSMSHFLLVRHVGKKVFGETHGTLRL